MANERTVDMHLLTLVSELFTRPAAPKRGTAQPEADVADDVRRRLAAMGLRLSIAPRAVRARRARAILWALWADRFARGEESRSFDALMQGCR